MTEFILEIPHRLSESQYDVEFVKFLMDHPGEWSVCPYRDDVFGWFPSQDAATRQRNRILSGSGAYTGGRDVFDAMTEKKEEGDDVEPYWRVYVRYVNR